MPHEALAVFYGGPCDQRRITIYFDDKPPESLACRRVVYYFYPHSRGGLAYVTPDYLASLNVGQAAAQARDVFRAWHRLMHAMAVRAVGERRRVIAARHRIRRAVR